MTVESAMSTISGTRERDLARTAWINFQDVMSAPTTDLNASHAELDGK
jgi:hypothetical protein